MKYTFIICTFLLLSIDTFGQHAHFTTSGTIQYDKNINMFGVIKKEIGKNTDGIWGQAFESYKKNNPQFKTLKSTLTFSKTRSLFNPIIPETTINNGFFGDNPMANQNNVIYTDFATNTSISQKKVFEETFLVKDSTRKIRWKITDETREIAGYTCRRANAIMMDSIYVVAFYTTEIPISGGPESFSGLPGMILGVALPHDNVTWFATKVTDMTPPENALNPPKKGKATDNKGLNATLKSVMKDWGDYGQSYLKAFLL
jgi:GLPGLI family protein